ncbi:MAG: phosphatidylserine decarboxylase family protein [Cyclobacteriaceae bacterium]|nr:phosphatidylserine decarboxylase family protein [Cyclobacteriaceae bacterium]
MTLHREGNFIIPISAVILSLLYLLLTWLLPFELSHWLFGLAGLVTWALIIHFFRVPSIDTPQGEKLVIAPAEGKVVVIEQTHESEYLGEDRIQVSIFMSPLNVHVNRSPVNAKISYYKYHPGKFLVAWHPKSSTDNERTSIGYEMADGTKLLMRQIAGALARRIRFYKQAGDPVNGGQEVGFIRFGSRVDVFLPLNARIKVKIGDKTSGGETIIAELPA